MVEINALSPPARELMSKVRKEVSGEMLNFARKSGAPSIPYLRARRFFSFASQKRTNAPEALKLRRIGGGEKMRTNIYRRTQALVVWLMALAMFAMPLSAPAQTRISYHSNRYKITDDVQAGRQAAAEVA